MNQRRIRNLVHWKIMILLTILIWMGISKVAASFDSSEVEKHKNDTALQIVERTSHKVDF